MSVTYSRLLHQAPVFQMTDFMQVISAEHPPTKISTENEKKSVNQSALMYELIWKILLAAVVLSCLRYENFLLLSSWSSCSIWRQQDWYVHKSAAIEKCHVCVQCCHTVIHCLPSLKQLKTTPGCYRMTTHTSTRIRMVDYSFIICMCVCVYIYIYEGCIQLAGLLIALCPTFFLAKAVPNVSSLKHIAMQNTVV